MTCVLLSGEHYVGFCVVTGQRDSRVNRIVVCIGGPELSTGVSSESGLGCLLG